MELEALLALRVLLRMPQQIVQSVVGVVLAVAEVHEWHHGRHSKAV
jgi:hypothetical protein